MNNLIQENKVTNLQIFLTDDDDNVIDLNGCHWDAFVLINYITNEDIDKKIPDELLPN